MPSQDNTPSSPFGRGWIPAGREIGVGDDLPCPRAEALRASAPPREPTPSSPPETPNLPAVRHDSFTPDRQARFLAALAVVGSVRSAAAAVGVSAQAVYLCRRRSAHFAAGWDAALVLAREHAEQVLAERALDGVEEAVFYRGEEVARRRRFDSRLLLAHLARLDRRCADDPAARRRAGRFDELLATLMGEEAPGIAAQPWQRGHDPFLPPERAAHVAQAADGLGPRAYSRARARAEAEWDRWRGSAEAAVDRLNGAPEREYKSQPPPVDLAPTPAQPEPFEACPEQGRRGRVLPRPKAPQKAVRTVSTVSTSPHRRARARLQKSTAIPFCSQSP